MEKFTLGRLHTNRIIRNGYHEEHDERARSDNFEASSVLGETFDIGETPRSDARHGRGGGAGTGTRGGDNRETSDKGTRRRRVMPDDEQAAAHLGLTADTLRSTLQKEGGESGGGGGRDRDRGLHQYVQDKGGYRDEEFLYTNEEYLDVATPMQPMHPLDLQTLLERFDTEDMMDLEEDEYQGLSRPKKSKGLLAKYNLPVVKIGQAHSTTDTYNKKLKVKERQQASQSSVPDSSKNRPRWNNFHQNVKSHSKSSNKGHRGGDKKPKAGVESNPGGGRATAAERNAKDFASPRTNGPSSVSKPSHEEIEQRKNWRKMRKKLEDERLKLAAKHESDKLREAEKLSARKKQMAREASLARQHEIQTRIKRIAEEKQKIQLQLIEDLREKVNTSKHAASVQTNSDNNKAPLKKKKVLPKLKSSKAMSPHANIYGNSSASKQQELKSKRSKKPGKNPAPQKLPKLKSMSSKTPISESSRANSWKHVRPRIFTNFKAKFINRSTSPLVFEEEEEVVVRQQQKEDLDEQKEDSPDLNLDINVHSTPNTPLVSPSKEQEDWRLVCTLHLQSITQETLLASPPGYLYYK